MENEAEEREQKFRDYLAGKTAYNGVIVSKGRQPWFDQDEKRKALSDIIGVAEDSSELDFRRALYMRRYNRPSPPAGMPRRTLAEIRGRD